MCGIAGFFSSNDLPEHSPEILASMLERIRHRGPDGQGHFIDRNQGVALGHTRIGLAVGPDRFVPVIRKLAGFRDVMHRLLGVEDVTPLVGSSLFGVEGGGVTADRLLDAGCTAIVCGSDLMALGAVRAIRARGLRVPEDVSVVGYDDSLLVGFTDPPLTTIRQSVTAMAAAAVRALLDEIAGIPAPRAEYVFRPELVVRASTGAVPVLA